MKLGVIANGITIFGYFKKKCELYLIQMDILIQGFFENIMELEWQSSIGKNGITSTNI
jgi:hypothetical protein